MSDAGRDVDLTSKRCPVCERMTLWLGECSRPECPGPEVARVAFDGGQEIGQRIRHVVISPPDEWFADDDRDELDAGDLIADGGKKGKTKTITGYAIVDWKKGDVRSRKTKPTLSELGNNELLANLRFDVHVPEIDIPTLAAEIDVPEPMVYSATLEALDDRELPDYAKTADGVITEVADELLDAEPDELEGLVSSIVVQTLRETRGRPRVELVEEYVTDVVEEIREPSA